MLLKNIYESTFTSDFTKQNEVCGFAIKTLLNKTDYFEEISNNDLKISISVIKTSQQLNGSMQ